MPRGRRPLTPADRDARECRSAGPDEINTVARAAGWDALSTEQLGIMLWTLLRYYVSRLASK